MSWRWPPSTSCWSTTAVPVCRCRSCRCWRVLPATGGLTRLTDKRMVRRDRADVFCSTEEGVRGRRAVEWRLVDEVVPPSAWEAKLQRTRGGHGRAVGPAGSMPRVSCWRRCSVTSPTMA